MTLRVPPHVASIAPYEPGKPVEELEREYGVPNAVKLASNENPLGPSPKAVEAIRLAASGVHFYPDGGGYYLREKLAVRLGVGMENVVLGAGSNELLDLLARAYLAPGDEAVMAAQAFVVYRLATVATGARATEVPMRNDAHDLAAMAEAIGPRTRIVFVANPNNPSGTIVRRAEVEAFLRRAPEDVLVVTDEAYFEYARRDPEYPDSLEGFSEDRAVVTLRTFSKAYALAGLRIGYGVMPKEIARTLNRIRPPFNTSSVAQAAALAALDDAEHLGRSLAVNEAGRRQLEAGFARLGLAFTPTWGNFLLVSTANARLALPGAELYERLLRMGVIVRPMGGYGYPDRVRITVGTEAENARLLGCLEKLYGRPAA